MRRDEEVNKLGELIASGRISDDVYFGYSTQDPIKKALQDLRDKPAKRWNRSQRKGNRQRDPWKDMR